MGQTDRVTTVPGQRALALAQAADLRGGTIMGTEFRKLHRLVRQVSAPLTMDRPLADDIAALRTQLQSKHAQRLLRPRPAGPESATRERLSATSSC